MRGYKDLFPVEEYRSEYRKAARKESLHKKDQIGFQNPVKEAISNRKVENTSNLYYIRQVGKVAPSYLHRLKDLQEFDKQLQRLKDEKEKLNQRDQIFSIKFSSKVLEERSPTTYFRTHKEIVWKEPDVIKSNRKIITAGSTDNDLSKIKVDHGMHGLQGSDSIKRASLSGSDDGMKMGKSLREEEILGKKETYSTRNVEYMLDIWQKSEGINLDKFLREEEVIQLQKKIEAKERSMELAKERERKIQENQLYLQAFNANVTRNANPDDQADKNKIKKAKENVNTDGTIFQLKSLTEELSNITEREVSHYRRKSVVANPSDGGEHIHKSESFSPRSLHTPTKNGAHLSDSTMKVLKKLSLEDNENSKPGAAQVLKFDNPDEIVKLTLTGPREVDMQPHFLSDGNRSFVPIRVKRRHLETTYSPGAWSKLIKSSFLPNGEIRISESSTNEIEHDKRQFQLILNDLNDLDNGEDANQGLTNYKGHDIMEEAQDIFSTLPDVLEENTSQSPQGSGKDISRPTPMQRRLSMFQRQLSAYNQKNMSSEKKILTLEELNKISKARKDKERLESKKKYFSLINFCGLVKRFLKYHFEGPGEESFGLPHLPPGAPPLDNLGDFISSSYCDLEVVPETDLVARISLVRALSLALREAQQKELCYEAAQIIIKSGISTDLGRWDSLLLKDVLAQMLIEGSGSDKDEACIAFCEANQINDDVIQHLRTGFGDLDDSRRQKLNFFFSNLDLKFSPLIMDILMEDSSNVNFRVRIDIIHHLENFITRLGSTIQRPKVLKHKKYSSYDYLEDSVKEAVPPLEPEEESETDSMIFNSIEVLLGYMWEDWSEQVRALASSALGRLQQGNAIYNHLIYLSRSEVPAKRLDALKCLGYMGLITKNTLADFIESLKDPYAAIRLEACKVACKLKSDHRELVAALLDCFSDSSWQIRAFSIKAVGLSRSQSPKVRTALHWCMMHDEVPAVRAEAVVAFKNLGFVESHNAGKEWLVTLLQTDTSDTVKKAAEKALVESGIMLPATNLTEESGGEMMSSLLARIPAHLCLPFPNILQGKSKEEVEIFLRDALIEDKEQLDVINQVRLLSNKETVIQQVQHEERHSRILPKLHLDLTFDQDHIPNLKDIHNGHHSSKAHPPTDH